MFEYSPSSSDADPALDYLLNWIRYKKEIAIHIQDEVQANELRDVEKEVLAAQATKKSAGDLRETYELEADVFEDNRFGLMLKLLDIATERTSQLPR